MGLWRCNTNIDRGTSVQTKVFFIENQKKKHQYYSTRVYLQHGNVISPLDSHTQVLCLLLTKSKEVINSDKEEKGFVQS